MKKRKAEYVLIIVACLLMVFVFYKVISTNATEDTDIVLTTSTVEVVKGDIGIKVSGTGNLNAISRKELESESLGIVEQIFVSEGQLVEEGDLLLTLDSDLDEIDIERAQLSLLLQEKELQSLEDDKKALKIFAPASGLIGDTLPSPGEELSKGYKFTTITDQNKMELNASFFCGSEAVIQKGDKAEVFLQDYLISIEGTVSSVSKVDYNNDSGISNYNVIITIDNPGKLTPGMIVTVTLINESGRFSPLEDPELKWKTAKVVNLDVGGTLTALYVSPGEWVKKGQLLAELESESLEDQLEDQKIKVKQGHLDMDATMEEMQDRSVYAPISGTVLDINVTEGEEITENRTSLVTLADLSALEVIIPVDELDILKIKEGQKAVITADAITEKTFEARVVKISQEGQTSGGVSTFDVTLRLEEPGELMAGMTVEAEIITASREGVLMLPVAAIQEQGNKKIVLVKGQEGDASQGNLTEIETGLVSEDMVEVVEGLQEGDIVLYSVATAGTQELNTEERGNSMMMPMGGGGPPAGAERGQRQQNSGQQGR